ncbi:M28 family peptidase [Candidatus Bathyarchaeota archaeon]|nr:M28 family peptidase [Candidatus Bathyarchaeota archaeon]
MNPYSEVDKKILGEIYSSNEPMENLEVLCDKYGARWPGTPEDIGSVKYMVDKLKEYGLEDAYYEPFKIPGWERGPAKLEVTAPIQMEFDVISLPFSIGGEIEAKLVDLGPGPLDIYEKRKDEIDGNVVMCSSARPQGMTRSLHRSEKFNRSVLAGAKGWIFMNHYPAYGPPTGGVSPIIPSVGLAYEDGTFIQRLLKREGEVTIKITTTDKNMEVTTHNIIGDVDGTSGDKEHVVTGSHYDGHDISQGAVDPASGAVVVMEMARVVNMVKDKLKRRIRFMCFGAEEIGLFGSYAYTAMHEDELGDCRFMLNLDAAGGTGRKGVTFHDYPELEPYLEKWREEMSAEMPMGQRAGPYSDHWPFFLKGVPSGGGGDSEARAASTGRGYGHTKYDTVDKVDRTYLRLAAANYSRFLFRVANADDWAPRRKSPEDIEAFIKKMGYDETVALNEKVKEYVSGWDEHHPDTVDYLNRKSAW